MEFRQLKVFLRIAELGSISAAAEQLFTAQPALSRQIHLLEEELKVRLFLRHGRGVRLTPEGEILRRRASSLMRELEATRNELVSNDANPIGQVALALPPTVADILGVTLCERLARDYPNIRLRISTGYSGHVREWLTRGQIDIAVTYEPNLGRESSVRPQLVERLALIGTPQMLAQEGPEIPFSHLVSYPLILPSGQHGLRKLADIVAAEHGITLETAIEADSLQLQLQLVERGMGVTILPTVVVYEAIRAGRLVALPIREPHVSRSLIVALANDRAATLAIKSVRRAIYQVAIEMVHEGRWDAMLL